MNCHSQIWTNSPLLEPVRESYRDGHADRVDARPRPARLRLLQPQHPRRPRAIGCATCHGPVDQMPLMWQHASLQMEWCLDCHRDPAKYVRPREEVFNLAYEPPADPGFGARLVKEYHIQSPRVLTSCSTCHR